MKGETLLVNGDRWTIVDVAPAAALAEMVAAILEEEGFVVMTRAPGNVPDVLSHLGTHTIGTTYTLVPEAEAERALALLADTVTDYEGEELDLLLAQMAEEGLTVDDLADLLDEDDEESDTGDRRDGSGAEGA